MHERIDELNAAQFTFDNTFARLPGRFYTRLAPTPVSSPKVIKVNNQLAEILGLDPEALESCSGATILSGNSVPKGSEPLAMVYAGHQFGGWVPQLGDGRAILLGEIVGRDGVRRDIQLKGAGPTPYSRSGDGRAALGPVLREYILSEAMWRLGIATTRALAVVDTGDIILREEELPGAIVVRVAESHIRVGTFQFFSSRSDTAGLKALADYVIERHFPSIDNAEGKYESLLEAVVRRQASLIAHWQLIGFIHGVMNTDNTSVVGETIDYGPCAFMDSYDPKKVFSSIDQFGRYAYSNQPGIGYWNIACFSQALLPLIGGAEKSALDRVEKIVGKYPELFREAYLVGLRKKLGLRKELQIDETLGQDLLQEIAEEGMDYTVTFRHLVSYHGSNGPRVAAAQRFFGVSKGLKDWIGRWSRRLEEDGVDSRGREAVMESANPVYIPRNHLVEEAIRYAVRENDYSYFHKLIAVLENPYEEVASLARYGLPPEPHEEVKATFCGT
ncbi:MAG: YdiU family protein [Pseudomonadota bacterium]|nr:YdiU family protein [Pseudomonadota bacterium]